MELLTILRGALGTSLEEKKNGELDLHHPEAVIYVNEDD